ncbi:hypothetical protein KKH38_01945, partial [Patescibacteria group bacterium]|nr:hypothetical protein [Patescibacteria group bacterium]
SGCGSALDERVDGTMGDMGVEGTVVAGAFEGYCDDGFVWVPGSAKYGTLPGFCVMANEMKAENSNEAIVNVKHYEAILTCQGIGDGYHLISENEWLTIAENIIRVAENDIDEETEGLQLATSTMATTTEFILSNGNKIFNLIGGIAEWIDQTITKTGLVEPINENWYEYYEITDYKGMSIAPPYYYSSENGIGQIKTGDNNNEIRGFVRGANALYDLDLSNSFDTAIPTIGFRCAR